MLSCLFPITGSYCIYKNMEIVLFLLSLFLKSFAMMKWKAFSESLMDHHLFHMHEEAATGTCTPAGAAACQLSSGKPIAPFSFCYQLLICSAEKKKRSVPTTQALDKSAIRLLQCCRFCTGLMESCSRALHQAPSCPACTWALTWPSCQTEAKWIKGSDQGLAAGQPFSAGIPGEWKASPTDYFHCRV